MDAVARLETIQKKLIDNKKINEQLQQDFNICLQNNLEYLKHNFQQLYSFINKHTITSKKVVCFENGEANVLDLKTGSLLYGDFPISETQKQIKQWLEGENVFIKIGKISPEFTLKNDNFCQLHNYSRYSIEHEITKFMNEHIDSVKLKAHEISQELPMLAINGGGLGYPLLELCSKVEPKFIFYIEPDIELFLCSLGVIDWAQVINFLQDNNQTIFFIIGQKGTQSYATYHNDVFREYPFLQSFQLIYTHYQSEDTDRFLEEVKSNASRGFSSNGMFDDSLFGINNILLNSQKYNYLKNEEHNTFSNLPIAIIANGPSLDDDLDYLSKHQNCFITVACGTSITALDKKGIIPDFYVALERLDEVYKSLLYVKNQDIFKHTINISMNVVHPLTMNMFSNNLIVSKPGEQLPYYFKDLSSTVAKFNDIMICEHANPLVANCAISIFLNLQFENYFLFGVDNGSVNPRKHHSENSFYYELQTNKRNNSLNTIDSEESVKGNFNDKIYTNSLFNTCRKHIEIEIRKRSDARVHNCSNGAYIAGTIPVHSSELNIIDDITKSKVEYKNYLQKVKSKKVNLNQSDIDFLFNQRLFNQTVDQIIYIWSSDRDFTSRLSIIEKMQDTRDFLFQNNLNFFKTALMGSLCTYFSLIIYGLYIFKSNELSVKLAGKCVDHLINFLNMSKEEFKNANHIIQGQHFNYLPREVYEKWKTTRETN